MILFRGHNPTLTHIRMGPAKDGLISRQKRISGAPLDAGDVPAGTVVVVTSVIRLKAVLPHFDAHD